MVKSPAMIHKLGHFGYETDNYEDTCSWYTKYFNFRPTDVLHAPGNESLDVGTFFRIDLGKEYVDHHCLLVVRGHKPGTRVHHSSFEVEDLDTQFMGKIDRQSIFHVAGITNLVSSAAGHQWLLDQGYDLVWGIGRHVHGSQVFDYWYDSSGFIIEHYADGDVVNADTELLRAEAGNMAVWGPPVPSILGGKQQISA